MQFFRGKRGQKGSSKPVLERHTADEKQERVFTFRRHSAPSESSTPASNEPAYYGGSLPSTAANPAVLCELPTPVLDLLFDLLSLQELISCAALVHSSWHASVVDEALWRRRLAGKLPQELVSCFNRGGTEWTKRVAQFFSKNLLTNPEFQPPRLSVAVGVGKGSLTSSSWRVPAGCWQAGPLAEGSRVAELAFPSSCQANLRVLAMNAPSWAVPEAVQEVNLLDCLVSQGMSSAVASVYLDTCPAISFSVWCHSGGGGPRGYAVCVLDNGRDAGVGWLGWSKGSRLAIDKSKAHWISWAPEDSLLRGCIMREKASVQTERGEFRRLACVFKGYRKGVRRVHIILKGGSVQQSKGESKDSPKPPKPYTEFAAPCLRFAMPDV